MRAQLLLMMAALCCPYALSASDLLAYNLRTTVEAYEKIGRRDSKWNENAIQCLTAFARVRATTNGAIAGFLARRRGQIAGGLAQGGDVGFAHPDPALHNDHVGSYSCGFSCGGAMDRGSPAASRSRAAPPETTRAAA